MASGIGSGREKRDRLATLLLLGLVACILSTLPAARWHGALSCDSRTHIEMMRGVAEHGLPYTTNGPVHLHPELQARWNLADGDRLWGTYPPLFAYVAAPFFRLGGLPLVSRLNIVVLLLFALATFAVASRFLRDRLGGVIAAGLVVFGSPVPATAIDMSPYILSDALFMTSTWVVLAHVDSRSRSALIALAGAGILGALSVAAHLLAFPMVVGLLLALAVDARDDAKSGIDLSLSALVRAWLPSRFGIERSGAFLGGLLLGLSPVSLLNWLRFHSLSPISYGPCPWRSCDETGQSKQHLLDMLIFAGPTLLWLALAVAALLLLRRRASVGAAILVALVAVMIAARPLRTHAWDLLRITWGNVIDVSLFDMQAKPAILKPEDGIGNMLGPWVIRSLIECSPVLILAPVVAWLPRNARRFARVFALPAVLGLVALALRANQPIAFAFGFPILFLRYTTPLVPPLMILAVATLRSLRWSAASAWLTPIAGMLVALALWGGWDTTLSRRLLLTAVPVAAGAFTMGSAWIFLRKPSRYRNLLVVIGTATCVALSIGTSSGVSISGMRDVRDGEDIRTDAVMRTLPERAAVVGYSAEIDPSLSQLEDRDIEYADLYESKGWDSVMRLMDRWNAENRPIYAFLTPDSKVPGEWSNYEFEPVLPSENVFRIRKKSP